MGGFEVDMFVTEIVEARRGDRSFADLLVLVGLAGGLNESESPSVTEVKCACFRA